MRLIGLLGIAGLFLATSALAHGDHGAGDAHGLQTPPDNGISQERQASPMVVTQPGYSGSAVQPQPAAPNSGAQPSPNVERSSERKENLEGYWQRRKERGTSVEPQQGTAVPLTPAMPTQPTLGGRTGPGHADTQGQKGFMRNPYRYTPPPAGGAAAVPTPAFGGRQEYKGR